MTALCVARVLFPTESAALEGDGMPMVLLWLVLGVCWLLSAIGQSQTPVQLGWTSAVVFVFITLHTSAALVGMIWAQRPAANMLWEWIGMGVMFFLARQFIVTPREARAVVAAMIAMGAALSAHGIYQSAVEFPRNRAEYAANPDAALRAMGLPLDRDSPERTRFESRLQNNEPLTNFALTNSLAGYLAPWLVIGFGLIVTSCKLQVNRMRIALCLLPIAICLVLTKSRSGYIAATVGLVGVLLLCRPRPWVLRAVVVTALLVGLSGMVLMHDSRLVHRATQSLGYRLQYWQASLNMVADHPWLGVGPGNFQNEYTRYKLPTASEEVSDPHNFLLEIAATAGIPAAVTFLFLVLLIFLPQRTQRNTEEKDYPRFVVMGVVGGFLLAMPMSMISIGRIEAMTWLLGLPVAVVCLLALQSWVDHGELDARLPAVGVATLLIHLSANGGIGFPGVAGTLWLLMAIGLNLNESNPPLQMPRWKIAVILAAAIAVLIACYLTAYWPVMALKANMRQAQADPIHAEQYLLAAAAADPWDARPWNQLAVIAFADGEQFEYYSAQGLARDPHASPAWLHLADCEMKIFQRTGEHSHLERAIQAYRKAVELYPNNCIYHGRLALALQADGNEIDFRHEANRALELDHLTPHLDKKLPAELKKIFSAQ